MLKDMQTRGYAILVKQDDGSYVRALEIDAEHACYIISGEASPVTLREEVVPESEPAKRPRGRPRKSVPIAGSHAVGIGRSAGG